MSELNVVIDANVFTQDYDMSGAAFNLFTDGCVRLGFRPCISKIVVQEVVNNFRADLIEQSTNLDKSVTKLAKLIRAQLRHPFDLKKVERKAAEFKRRFEKQLRSCAFRILSYPAVPLETLVLWDLSGKKPFKGKGQGFRDALIWSSVLSLAKKSHVPIAFISNDQYDFAFGDPARLHPDLEESIRRQNIAANKISYHLSLDAFNKAVILPRLQPLNDIRDAIVGGTFPIDVRQKVEDWTYQNALNEINFRFGQNAWWLDNSLGNESPDALVRATLVRTIKGIRFVTVYEMNPSEVILFAILNLEVDVEVSGKQDLSEWQLLQLLPHRVEEIREFEISLHLSLDLKSKKIRRIAINSIALKSTGH